MICLGQDSKEPKLQYGKPPYENWDKILEYFNESQR